MMSELLTYSLSSQTHLAGQTNLLTSMAVIKEWDAMGMDPTKVVRRLSSQGCKFRKLDYEISDPLFNFMSNKRVFYYPLLLPTQALCQHPIKTTWTPGEDNLLAQAMMNAVPLAKKSGLAHLSLTIQIMYMGAKSARQIKDRIKAIKNNECKRDYSNPVLRYIEKGTVEPAALKFRIVGNGSLTLHELLRAHPHSTDFPKLWERKLLEKRSRAFLKRGSRDRPLLPSTIPVIENMNTTHVPIIPTTSPTSSQNYSINKDVQERMKSPRKHIFRKRPHGNSLHAAKDRVLKKYKSPTKKYLDIFNMKRTPEEFIFWRRNKAKPIMEYNKDETSKIYPKHCPIAKKSSNTSISPKPLIDIMRHILVSSSPYTLRPKSSSIHSDHNDIPIGAPGHLPSSVNSSNNSATGIGHLHSDVESPSNKMSLKHSIEDRPQMVSSSTSPTRPNSPFQYPTVVGDIESANIPIIAIDKLSQTENNTNMSKNPESEQDLRSELKQSSHVSIMPSTNIPTKELGNHKGKDQSHSISLSLQPVVVSTQEIESSSKHFPGSCSPFKSSAVDVDDKESSKISVIEPENFHPVQESQEHNSDTECQLEATAEINLNNSINSLGPTPACIHSGVDNNKVPDTSMSGQRHQQQDEHNVRLNMSPQPNVMVRSEIELSHLNSQISEPKQRQQTNKTSKKPGISIRSEVESCLPECPKPFSSCNHTSGDLDHLTEIPIREHEYCQLAEKSKQSEEKFELENEPLFPVTFRPTSPNKPTEKPIESPKRGHKWPHQIEQTSQKPKQESRSNTESSLTYSPSPSPPNNSSSEDVDNLADIPIRKYKQHRPAERSTQSGKKVRPENKSFVPGSLQPISPYKFSSEDLVDCDAILRKGLQHCNQVGKTSQKHEIENRSKIESTLHSSPSSSSCNFSSEDFDSLTEIPTSKHKQQQPAERSKQSEKEVRPENKTLVPGSLQQISSDRFSTEDCEAIPRKGHHHWNQLEKTSQKPEIEIRSKIESSLPNSPSPSSPSNFSSEYLDSLTGIPESKHKQLRPVERSTQSEKEVSPENASLVPESLHPSSPYKFHVADLVNSDAILIKGLQQCNLVEKISHKPEIETRSKIESSLPISPSPPSPCNILSEDLKNVGDNPVSKNKQHRLVQRSMQSKKEVRQENESLVSISLHTISPNTFSIEDLVDCDDNLRKKYPQHCNQVEKSLSIRLSQNPEANVGLEKNKPSDEELRPENESFVHATLRSTFPHKSSSENPVDCADSSIRGPIQLHLIEQTSQKPEKETGSKFESSSASKHKRHGQDEIGIQLEKPVRPVNEFLVPGPHRPIPYKFSSEDLFDCDAILSKGLRHCKQVEKSLSIRLSPKPDTDVGLEKNIQSEEEIRPANESCVHGTLRSTSSHKLSSEDPVDCIDSPIRGPKQLHHNEKTTSKLENETRSNLESFSPNSPTPFSPCNLSSEDFENLRSKHEVDVGLGKSKQSEEEVRPENMSFVQDTLRSTSPHKPSSEDTVDCVDSPMRGSKRLHQKGETSQKPEIETRSPFESSLPDSLIPSSPCSVSSDDFDNLSEILPSKHKQQRPTEKSTQPEKEVRTSLPKPIAPCTFSTEDFVECNDIQRKELQHCKQVERSASISLSPENETYVEPEKISSSRDYLVSDFCNSASVENTDCSDAMINGPNGDKGIETRINMSPTREKDVKPKMEPLSPGFIASEYIAYTSTVAHNCKEEAVLKVELVVSTNYIV